MKIHISYIVIALALVAGAFFIALVNDEKAEASYQAEVVAYEQELFESANAEDATYGGWRDRRRERNEPEVQTDENGEVIPNDTGRKRWRDRPERKGLAFRFGKGLQQVALGAALCLGVFVGGVFAWKWATK